MDGGVADTQPAITQAVLLLLLLFNTTRTHVRWLLLFNTTRTSSDHPEPEGRPHMGKLTVGVLDRNMVELPNGCAVFI